jgi:hypothetical protein
VLEGEYTLARRLAATETQLEIGTFPEKCPYTIEQLLDFDFMP